MLPEYILTIDVIAPNSTIDEKPFRELLAPCLSLLDSLKGAFDRRPSTIVYYPPGAQYDIPDCWSARGIVMISLGKDRAECLVELYRAIARLIALELPECEVRWKVDKSQFS